MRVTVVHGERQVEIHTHGLGRNRLERVEKAARRILADLAAMPDSEPARPVGFTLGADTDRAPDDEADEDL